MLKRRKRKRKSLWSVPDTTRWCGCCKKITTFTFNRIIRHSECTNCGWRKIIVMDRKTTYTDEELDEMEKEYQLKGVSNGAWRCHRCNYEWLEACIKKVKKK